jgi:glycosyltransferase involved in cell wall biosynthesis
MSKNIGMVLDAFYPSDIRVNKEASALIDAGFSVSLLCKRRKNEEKEEVVDGINVVRIWSGQSNFSKGIIDVIHSVFFVHPIFVFHIKRFLKQNKIDVIHVHDLPIVKTAILAAKKTNIRVVSDFHENYPEALRIWFQWKTNPIIRFKNRLFFGYKRWMNYESWAINNSDYIIAVVEEMRDRIISHNPQAVNKVVVVTNTENKNFVNSPLNQGIYKEDVNKFIITYTGGVGPHRGVDTAILAMTHLAEYHDIVMYIVGSLSDAARKKLNELIQENNLEGKVHILGYRPFELFYSYMKMAAVNIIPHHSNGHTDHTIPHKLFQCMMTGKPVLVSTSAPLKRIINETKAGLYFEAGNAASFANELKELYLNNELRIQLGNNGKEATLNGTYNWESSSSNLVSLYKNILD